MTVFVVEYQPSRYDPGELCWITASREYAEALIEEAIRHLSFARREDYSISEREVVP